MPKYFYALYDERDGLPCGTFEKLKEVAAYLGMTLASVYCGISRGVTFKQRYTIYKIKGVKKDV